jgi:hypothetical protein
MGWALSVASIFGPYLQVDAALRNAGDDSATAAVLWYALLGYHPE